MDTGKGVFDQYGSREEAAEAAKKLFAEQFPLKTFDPASHLTPSIFVQGEEVEIKNSRFRIESIGKTPEFFDKLLHRIGFF